MKHTLVEAPTGRQAIYLAIASIIIPVEIFLCFFHWQILIPTNVAWLLQGDWGAHVIGWNAFRHDAWAWPLGSTQLLAWPNGVTVTYTDSTPLLCLLLKPFSALLPTPFQFSGLWLLSCIVLQFATARMLLRPHVHDQFLQLIGATLLTLLPTLIDRMIHVNLCAHWTILLSLHVFINVRGETRRDLWYALILLVSALVHPYLLLMNASIWGSDVLRRAVRLLEAGAFPQLAGLAVRSVLVAFAPSVALLATGALGGFRAEAGGFGYYSMALDALVNPGTSGYSALLPVARMGPGQWFEGFQYLGAGLLFAIAAAAATLAKQQGRERLRAMGWLAWLAPAMLALTVLALSDQVQLHGQVIAHIPLDWLPSQLTGAFRSSGRLFWPVSYALILSALLLVLTLPRPWAYALSLGALALQAADLSTFVGAERAQTLTALSPRLYARTPSPAWDQLIRAAEVVEFQPPDPHADQKAFYEIAWRASSLRRPINTMYTARMKPEQTAFENAARNRFIDGQVDPHRLYVLMTGCAPPSLPPEHLRRLDGLLVLPPAGLEAVPALGRAPAPAAFPVSRNVELYKETQAFRCMLGRDWAMPAGDGVRSSGALPQIVLRLESRPERDLVLALKALAVGAQDQDVAVSVAGRTLAHLRLTGQPAPHAIRVPAALVQEPQVTVLLQPGGRIELRSVRLDPAR